MLLASAGRRAHLRTVHYLKLQDYRSAYLTTSGRSAIVRRSVVAAATTSKKRKSRHMRRGRRPAAAKPLSNGSVRQSADPTVRPEDTGSPSLAPSKTVPRDQKLRDLSESPSPTGNQADNSKGTTENTLGQLVTSLSKPPQPHQVFVDNFEESCLSLCRLCGLVYPMDSIRSHLKIAHLTNIRQYREQHGRLEYVRETYIRLKLITYRYFL